MNPTTRKLRWRQLALSALLLAPMFGAASAHDRADRTPALVPNAFPPSMASQQRAPAVPQWLAFYPVVVLPKNKGFQDLQDALDFCAARPGTAWTVLLGPGTHTGNFDLPPAGTVWIVGREGIGATVIEGEPGVNQPVLSFRPGSGPPRAEMLLFGLQVRASEGVAVDYQGSSSSSALMLQECFLLSQGSFSALSVLGGGYDASNRMSLELGGSWVDSADHGVFGNILSHVEIHCERTNVNAASTGILLWAPTGSQGNSLHVFGGRVEGTQAVNVTEVQDLVLQPYQLYATGRTLLLDTVHNAQVARTRIISATDDAIFASQTKLDLQHVQLETNPTDSGQFGVLAVSSSRVRAAHSGFSTAGSSGLSNNAMSVDGTSTASTAFNHWQFDPMP